MLYSYYPNIFTKVIKTDIDNNDELKQPYIIVDSSCYDVETGISYKIKTETILAVEFLEDRVIVTWSEGNKTECKYGEGVTLSESVNKKAIICKCIMEKLYDETYLNDSLDAFAGETKNKVSVADLKNTEFDNQSMAYKEKHDLIKINKIKLKNQKEYEEKRKALEEEYRKKLQEELAEANIVG